jgi:hypothetical protein
LTFARLEHHHFEAAAGQFIGHGTAAGTGTDDDDDI